MRRALTVLLAVSVLSPARGGAEYRPCTRAVPDDLAANVRKEVLGLRDASEVTRGYAAYALYRMGARAAPARPFLRHLLADDSPLRSHTTVGPSKWMGPTCPGVLAAEALWAIDPGELADVLKRDPAAARLHTTRYLGGLTHDSEAIGLLIAAAGDASADVRYVAVTALTRSSRPRALGTVRAAMGDPSAKVRARAVAGVGKAKDRDSLDAMLAILAADKDPWPRGYAAWYLGEFKDARAVAALVRALGDASPYVRRYAAGSLGVLGDARAVEPLVRLSGDPDAAVRREVGEALARFDDPRVAAAATGDLASSDVTCRRRAVAILGKYPDTYASHLIRALRDSDAKVRQEALEALSWARSRSGEAATAIGGVLRNIDKGPFFRESLVFGALARLGNATAVGELERVLLSPPIQLRHSYACCDRSPRAARALWEIGTPEARAALAKGLSAPSDAGRRAVQYLQKARAHTRRAPRPRRRGANAKPKPRTQPRPPDALAAAPAAAGRSGPSRPRQTPVVAGSRTGGAYRVTGIIGQVAMINGKAVRVGDTVGGAKVMRIRGMKVELDSGGRRFTIGVSRR